MRRRRSAVWGAASCFEVARVLQSFLDRETDELTAARISRHLEHCRRCGLEARTYVEIKAALARRVPVLDELAVERLRAFATHLVESPPAAEDTGL